MTHAEKYVDEDATEISTDDEDVNTYASRFNTGKDGADDDDNTSKNAVKVSADEE